MSRAAASKLWISYRSKISVWSRIVVQRLLLAGLRTRDRYYGESPTFLLLLAHTRSGSTLLHHLLSSHPEILGCGERKTTYVSPRDLELLRVSAHARRGQLLRRYRYVTDQINHNVFLASDVLLNHPQVRTVFLIREPVSSIASMVHWPGGNGLITTDIAITYYLDRLSALAGYAQRIQDRTRAFFLTYDDLIANTQSMLLSLDTFLGLHSALTERYQTFGFTGTRGDPSTNIQSGRVLQIRPQHRVALDTVELARLEEGYRNCQRSLRTHCLYSPQFENKLPRLAIT